MDDGDCAQMQRYLQEIFENPSVTACVRAQRERWLRRDTLRESWKRELVEGRKKNGQEKYGLMLL